MVAVLSGRRPLSWATVAGLFVAFVFPVLTDVGAPWGDGAQQSLGRIELGLAVHWLTFALLITIVLLAERQPLASVGVRRLRWWTIPLGLLAGVAVTGLSGVLVNRLGLSADAHFAAYLQSLPFAVRLMLVLTAGIFEEALYRGYAIERLTSLFGSKWLAGAVSVVIFTLMHVPAVGWSHVLPVGIVGVFVTLLYLWRRDLVVNMVAHATIDGIALLLVPMIGR